MPAIPLIVMGVSAASSAYQAHKSGQVAKQGMQMQQGMIDKQSGLANEISNFARGQMDLGGPAMRKAMEHYYKLASGSRGDIGSELAPDINAVTEASRGAERGLTARMGAGPGRDRAIADLYRQRAGQIGLMPFQARQNAFGQLGTMGQNLYQGAQSAYGGAASALTGASTSTANLAGYNNQAQANSNQQWGNIVNSAGSMAMDYYKNKYGSTGSRPTQGQPGWGVYR